MAKPEPDSRRGRRATGLYVAFVIGMLLVMIFPIYGLGNRVEPFVLGLPFSLFWIVFWIAVEFVVLLAFFYYEHGYDHLEDEL